MSETACLCVLKKDVVYVNLLITMEPIKVSYDVPPPKPGRKKTPEVEALLEMEPGGSFTIPERKRASVIASAKNHKLKIRTELTGQKTSEGDREIRVWKVEKKQ